MENDKLFDILREDRKQSEERLTRNIERMESRLMEDRKESEQRTNDAVDRLERKMDEVINGYKDTRRWEIGTFIATVALAIATIGGIAALVVSMIQQIKS